MAPARPTCQGRHRAMTKRLPPSFDELVRTSPKPVLVDFWAAWCGPCKMVSPVIERLAKEFAGRLLTVKINVDEKQHVAQKYEIQSIPTIMLFHKGRVLFRLAGARPEEELRREIGKALGSV